VGGDRCGQLYPAHGDHPKQVAVGDEDGLLVVTDRIVYGGDEALDAVAELVEAIRLDGLVLSDLAPDPPGVVGHRSSTSQDFDPDPFIGCIILRNLFFARRGDELPQPTHWSPNIVVSRGYNATDASLALDAEEVTEAFQLLLSQPRVDFTWEPDLRGVSLVWMALVMGSRC
jgi:hypothetical protein